MGLVTKKDSDYMPASVNDYFILNDLLEEEQHVEDDITFDEDDNEDDDFSLVDDYDEDEEEM